MSYFSRNISRNLTKCSTFFQVLKRTTTTPSTIAPLLIHDSKKFFSTQKILKLETLIQKRNLCAVSRARQTDLTDDSSTPIPDEEEVSTQNREKINYEIDSDFSKLNLPEEVLKRLSALGYKKPFPIQEKTLPYTIEGKDLVGKAITGSGKTLAFSIPIICKVLNSPNKASRFPKCLVLAPTRELCLQIHKSISELAPELRCTAVYGGAGMQNQIRELGTHCDIVCATPGRLKDLMQRQHFVQDHIELVCLDEADHLLKDDFRTDIEDFIKKGNQKKQILMFSATLSSSVKNLINDYMTDPVEVDITQGQKYKVPENIKHFSMKVPRYSQVNVVDELIKKYSKERCIVFTRTKAQADYISDYLKRKGIQSEGIHGDISQSRRERVLNSFRSGRFDVLVATDVAARGLDVPEVDLVVNVSIPANGYEYYVHRSGRTGRAGRPGVSILLYSGERDEIDAIKDIRRDVKINEIPCPIQINNDDEDRYSRPKRFDRFDRPNRFENRERNFDRSFGNSGFGDRQNRYRDSFDRNDDRPPRSRSFDDRTSRRFDNDEQRDTRRFGSFNRPSRWNNDADEEENVAKPRRFNADDGDFSRPLRTDRDNSQRESKFRFKTTQTEKDEL